MKKIIIKKFLCKFIIKLPLIGSMLKTKNTAAPITLNSIMVQKVFRINSNAYWPMHYSSKATGIENIKIGIGTAPGLSPGCYIQGAGKINIGDYTIIAPNVGIISSNHDIYDYSKHNEGNVSIGNYCWVGMNSVILPNVELGDHTIVAAGSVVNKSFNEGYCIIAGSPARKVKDLDKDKVIKNKNKYEFYGYISKEKYEKNSI